MIDSHAHVQSREFAQDRDAMFQRALNVQVELIVCPGTDAASSLAAVELARAGYPVAPTVGIHPGSVDLVNASDWERVRDLAPLPEVVAIGETGLDYHYARGNRPNQRASFLRHLNLAAELQLPVIVHARDAEDDVLRAIADWRGSDTSRIAILHCFVADEDVAQRALGLGCYLGVGGVLTYPSAEACRRSARLAPPDRLLIETDSPYLSPQPERRQRNEPARVALVAAELAKIRGLNVAEIAAITTENARQVFSLAPIRTATATIRRAQ